MKKIIIFLICINVTVYAQKYDVDISSNQTETGFVISAKNNTNIQQELTLTLDVKNLRGYKKPIVKLIPANTTLEIVTLGFIRGKKGSYTSSGSVKESPNVQEVALKKKRLEEKALKDVGDIKKGIVVFSKDGCTRCHYVTSYMLDNNIDFKFLNTTENKDYNILMWQLLKDNDPNGATLKSVTMPVVLIDGQLSYNMTDLKGFVSKLNK